MSKKLIKSATRESNGRGRMPNPSLTPPLDLFPSQREIPVSQKIRTNENLLPLESDVSEEFMEEYLPEEEDFAYGRGRMPRPSLTPPPDLFPSRREIPVSQKIRTEEDFADDLMTSQASDAMLRDLVKLATQFDNSGLYKEAERIDSLLEKLAGVYKSEAEGSNQEDLGYMKWYDRDTFDALDEKKIAEHYLVQKNMFGINTPTDYMEKHEVQDWQKDKVMRAIKNNPPSPSFQPQYQGYYQVGRYIGSESWKEKAMAMGDVTTDQLVKLLVADKDNGVAYKMSPDLFERIKSKEDLDYQDLSREDLVILGVLRS